MVAVCNRTGVSAGSRKRGAGTPVPPREATRQALGAAVVLELTPDGPEATIVTEIFDCSGGPEDEHADIDYGSIWVDSMNRALERLDGLCAGPPGTATPD